MPKTLLLIHPGGTLNPIAGGTASIEITDFFSPKSIIAKFTDRDDALDLVRWNPDDATWDPVTNGRGQVQLNNNNLDVTLSTPDIYGVQGETKGSVILHQSAGV